MDMLLDLVKEQGIVKIIEKCIDYTGRCEYCCAFVQREDYVKCSTCKKNCYHCNNPSCNFRNYERCNNCGDSGRRTPYCKECFPGEVNLIKDCGCVVKNCDDCCHICHKQCSERNHGRDCDVYVFEEMCKDCIK